MAKKGSHTPLPPIGDPADPDSLYAYMLRYLAWMRVKNYTQDTIENRQVYLRYFIHWCIERGLAQPQEITKPILERYQRYLFHYRKKNGEPLSGRSQHTRLEPIRAWFKWLTRENYILYNPASEIDLPRLEKRLPKNILTQTEAELVINQPDIKTAYGLRDRAILETLYSTGIRRMEAIQLNRYDIDAERGTLMVRQGKGRKDRLVPIGDRALAWILRYRNDVRPELAIPGGDDTLFITNLGQAFTRSRMSQLVRNYVNAADIGKTGSCHLFRHAMATLMLENGADIRFIQAMLGHTNLATTQIYTQVSISKLKEIHTATHPAKMNRTDKAEALDDGK
jgi:integrase/recombinase XerD